MCLYVGANFYFIYIFLYFYSIGPWHIYYDIQFSVFIGFLSVQASVSLILMPYLGLFLFVWSISDVIIFVLCYFT